MLLEEGGACNGMKVNEPMKEQAGRREMSEAGQ